MKQIALSNTLYIHSRNAMRDILHLLAWCALLVGIAYGEAAQNRAGATLGAIYALRDGAYGPATPEEVAEARAGQLIPMLKDRFDRTQDAEIKANIAQALVKLGDKGDMYWNLLIEQAMSAIESDAPSPRSSGYTAWAQGHNIAPGSSEEEALYRLPGKVNLLGGTADPRAIPLLRKALRSPNYEIVSAAVEGLALAHDKDSIPIIIELCRKAPADEVPQLASSLKEFDDPRAQSGGDKYLPEIPDPVEALKQASDDPDMYVEPIVKAKAVQAIPILQEKFTSSHDTNVKAHIASGLIRLGVKEEVYWNYLVEQAILAVESDEPNLMSFDAQGKVMPVPSPEFVAWADSHHISPGSAVENAMYLAGKLIFLADTGDPRAIPLLRQGLLTPNYQIEIAAAMGLAQLHDKESIQLIIEACKRNPEVAGAIGMFSLIYFDDPLAQSAAETYIPEIELKAIRSEKHKSGPLD